MIPYIRRPICSQLACLVLALAILAFPLASIRVGRAPLLIPLATDLVPLGTNLQLPPSGHLATPSFLTSPRLVLGPLPSTVFGLDPDCNGGIHKFAIRGFPDSRTIDLPNGRSPPSK
jgi:hypothetical protein